MYFRTLLLVLGFSVILFSDSMAADKKLDSVLDQTVEKANEIVAKKLAKNNEAISNEIDTGDKEVNEEHDIDGTSFPGTLSIDEKPDLCKDSKFDAITLVNDGSTYLFKGKYYWNVKIWGLEDDDPRLISDDWKGLPNDIDAAVTIDNHATYFFKGDKYWKFLNKQPYSGYPKPLSDGFSGVPESPDAVIQWRINGKLYFFRGSQFWRFDPNSEPSVTDDYPRDIRRWRGFPSSIDAAFMWINGKSYFFKDQRYYRFDDVKKEVDKNPKFNDIDLPKFPRSTAHWWFKCFGAYYGTVKEPSS